MNVIRLAAAALAFVAASSAHADSIQVDAIRDTAFYDTAPNNNIGGNLFVPVGQTNNGSIRRALFFLDVPSVIPAGATITAATFEFDVSAQGGPSGQQGVVVGLHRVTTAWDEGTGGGNIGQPTGDGATWLRATANTFWTNAGGDFATTSSGSVLVDQPDPDVMTYALGNAQLLADVQDMVDDPPGNFGFMLKGVTNAPGSAMRVASRENFEPLLGFPARLMIEFDPPPACDDTNGDGVVNFDDLIVVLSAWGPCPGCPGDLDGNDVVDFSDLILVLASWGPCGI